MPKSPEIKLHELLQAFSVAMLVTRNASGELRGRPMAIAEVAADGSLWFATDHHAGKVEELAGDPHVAVTMQSSLKFVSLSGMASLVDDRALVDRLWKLEWQVWFPGGKDDPNLILLKVDSHIGEYWDNSGTSGIKYLIKAGKALLTGTRPDVDADPSVHGKVDL